MTGYDEPSLDGRWNIIEKCSTWWSPYELYDRENLCANIIGGKWQFMAPNKITNIVYYETCSDFK